MSLMSLSVSSRQLTGRTGTPYFCSIASASRLESAAAGSKQLRTTTKGFPISVSSATTRCSASSYSPRGSSPKLPSVVTTRPMVEWSVITFFVPISAAMLKGTGFSNQGVMTMRGMSFSIYPSALGTI